MHLILKSTKATGERSFLRAQNKIRIRRVVDKFAFVYGVRVISFANAWNHLHLQIKLSNRFAYAPFIRAITGAIALAVAGRRNFKIASKVVKPAELTEARQVSDIPKSAEPARASQKFWDHRPFTRIAEGYKAYLTLKDYIRMNEIEAQGWRRSDARTMVQVEKQFLGTG